MAEREAKRVRQACLNCRRKKSRCSGERPVCAFCARLQQECTYEDFTALSSHDASLPSPQRTTTGSISSSSAERPREGRLPSNIAAPDSNLASRVAMLEAQLNLMNNLGSGAPFYSLTDLGSGDSTSRSRKPLGWAQPGFNSPPGASDRDSKFSSLPSAEVVDSLVETYFHYCHAQPYWYFREASFRRRLASNEFPTWLLLAFVATAARFSDNDFFQGRQEDAVDMYSQAAWTEIHKRIFSEDDFINIHAVQAMSMLAIIDFTAGKHQRGWVKIGLAVRFAEALSLSSEPAASLPPWLQEEHRWTFWSVYLLDRLVSCMPQHKPTIQDVDCTLGLPREPQKGDDGDGADDLRVKVTLASLRDRSQDGVDIDQAGHLVFVASALGRIQRCCLRKAVRGPYPPWDCRSDYAAIQTDLTIFESHSTLTWGNVISVLEDMTYTAAVENRDPAETMGVLCFSHMLYFLCQCLLNHPFLVHEMVTSQQRAVPPSYIRSTLQVSRENAVQLTVMLEHMLKTRTCLTSFAGYCAVVAGVIHKLFQRDKDPAIQDSSRRMYNLTLQFLREAPVRWRSFRAMDEALARFDPDAVATAALVDPMTLAQSLDHPDREEIWHLLDYGWMSDRNRQAMHMNLTAPPQASTLLDPRDSTRKGSEDANLDFLDTVFDIEGDNLLPANSELDMMFGVSDSTGGSGGWYRV